MGNMRKLRVNCGCNLGIFLGVFFGFFGEKIQGFQSDNTYIFLGKSHYF